MDTLERLSQIINQNTDFKDEIKLKDHLKNDLYLDSLDLLIVVRAIEDSFRIQIEEKDIKEIQTVQDIVRKLEQINS